LTLGAGLAVPRSVCVAVAVGFFDGYELGQEGPCGGEEERLGTWTKSMNTTMAGFPLLDQFVKTVNPLIQTRQFTFA
jgi:hypothetical protein